MLPGGATARVIKDDEEEEAGGRGARPTRAVTLRYDSATLGASTSTCPRRARPSTSPKAPRPTRPVPPRGELAGALRAPVAVIARRSVLDAQA